MLELCFEICPKSGFTGKLGNSIGRGSDAYRIRKGISAACVPELVEREAPALARVKQAEGVGEQRVGIAAQCVWVGGAWGCDRDAVRQYATK